MTSDEEFKVFVRWDDPVEPDDEDADNTPKAKALARQAPDEGLFGWVPLREAFLSMTSGDVFQAFVPATEGEEEEVWVWQKTNGDSGEDETFWDAVGPFTKKDVVRLSRLKASAYIDVDEEALIHGLRRYFRELRKLRAAKKVIKEKENGKEAERNARRQRLFAW